MKNHNARKLEKGSEAKMAREPAVSKHVNKKSGEVISTIENPRNPKRMPAAKSRTAEISRSPLQKS